MMQQEHGVSPLLCQATWDTSTPRCLKSATRKLGVEPEPREGQGDNRLEPTSGLDLPGMGRGAGARGPLREEGSCSES